MVQHKPTPEEQLLKLIENPGAAKSAGGGSGKKAETGKPSGFRLPDFGKWASSFAYLKAGAKRQAGAQTAEPFKLDLKFANRILIVLAISFGIYLIFDITSLKSGHADFLNQVGTNDAVFPPAFDPAKAAPRDLEYYQEPLSQRNPFFPPGSKTAAQSVPDTASAAPATPSAPIQEIMQSIKLVGISFGDEPLAMIEDVQTGRTYFLKRGQELKGIKVQSISKEKVVVTHDGQEAELF